MTVSARKSQAKRWVVRLQGDTLFVNAYYLILSTLVMAASGFVFWLLVAHIYDTTAVGIATTLLSASGLLSLLGLAGFDTTFVRFLPQSKRRNGYINSGFIVVTVVTLVLAVGFAVALPMVSRRLQLLDSPAAFVSFVFFTAVTALNVLTNAVFLAFKQARYIFVINSLSSGLKMFLPLLVGRGSALTIFVLAGVAQLFGLMLSIFCMVRSCGYRFSPSLDMNALHMVKRFSFGAYTASVLNLVPPTLLPLLIVYTMNAKSAAYYYIAFTIAGVLYTVAYASMQSAFAEGSHDESAMSLHILKAAKLIAILLFPAAVLTVFLSNPLLSLFGKAYAHEGATLLRLFALSALPVAVYSALGVAFKIKQNMRGMVGMNLVYAGVTLAVSYLLIPHQGLVAVGEGWAAGNLSACFTGMLLLLKCNKKGG